MRIGGAAVPFANEKSGGRNLITTFTEELDRHGTWRAGTAERLTQLAEWLRSQRLADGQLATRLEQIAQGLAYDKVVIAFVAEFSRGKSELINAIFFAQLGRRIVPASAGRTTMCPTEIAFDEGVPACLRLLPVETRLEDRPLSSWRAQPDAWTHFPLEPADPAQMAGALATVAQVRRVSEAAARALGFWDDQNSADNPLPGADGLVEVPMWRHALVNIDHPLLRHGLVVLDTPGLNAIGAEPELTVQLLAEAHASVFLLAADAGVTRSDLALWREHLAPVDDDDPRTDSRIVVLNKIDVLWDGISSARQVREQTERQREASAAMLGLPPARVIPVSAQRALLARIHGDAALLHASGLPILEAVLAEGIVERRHAILRGAVQAGLARMRSETSRTLAIRRREIDEQILELRSLRGKNTSVIAGMRMRVAQEQDEFDTSQLRVHALQVVHQKLLFRAKSELSGQSSPKEFTQLLQVLTQPGFRLGARRAYETAFAQASARLERASALAAEITAMLDASFRQLNAEFGFALQVPAAPNLDARTAEIAAVQQMHAHTVGLSHVMRLGQAGYASRLVQALGARVQTVLTDASLDLEAWSRSALAPVNVQLKERRQGFVRRIEAIDRIQQAAAGLGERMEELQSQVAQLVALEGEVSARAAAVDPEGDADAHATTGGSGHLQADPDSTEHSAAEGAVFASVNADKVFATTTAATSA